MASLHYAIVTFMIAASLYFTLVRLFRKPKCGGNCAGCSCKNKTATPLDSPVPGRTSA